MTLKPIKLEEPLQCYNCGFVMIYHDEWINGVCQICADEEMGEEE